MAVTHNELYLDGTWTGYLEGRVPQSRRASRDRGSGPPPRRWEVKGTPRGEGDQEGITCLREVTQQRSAESLGQRAPMGSHGLGSFIDLGFVFIYGQQRLGAISWLMGYAKQVGPKWVKKYLFGLYLNSLQHVYIYTQGPLFNSFIQHTPKENSRRNARTICLASLSCFIVSTTMTFNVDEP